MTHSAERMAPGHVYDPITGTGIEWLPQEVRLWEGGVAVATAPHATPDPWAFWYDLAFAETFPEVSHWWFGSAWTGKVWVRPIGTQTRGRTTVVSGGMRFIDRDEPEVTWQVTLEEGPTPAQTAEGRPEPSPVLVGVPLPPFAIQPVNLALRVALARLVFDLADGSRAAALGPDEELALRAVIGAVDLDRLPVAAQRAVLGEAGVLPALQTAVLAQGPAPDWITTVLNTVSPPHWVTSLVAVADLRVAFPTTVGPWRLEAVDRPLREALCWLQGLGESGAAP